MQVLSDAIEGRVFCLLNLIQNKVMKFG
uniref:Uncharacterized protein n=1 Tax=Anguilla anguilla TaxID=7936 RepID=A0A0E9XY14_ANGAN